MVLKHVDYDNPNITHTPLSTNIITVKTVLKPLRPSHTGVRIDTVTRGRSKSPAPEISVGKRR